MLENPLELQPPVEILDRVRAFARDLAYGVITDQWAPRFVVYHSRDGNSYSSSQRPQRDDRKALSSLIQAKWNNNPPMDYLLFIMGYFQLVDEVVTAATYLLTEKAFELLNKPASPPNVFISYKRNQSSALALLVEARLKFVGNPNPFVDKNLLAGDEWHGQLEAMIRQSKYFICLIGKETLASEFVRREIEWATQAPNCTVISVWHGCKMEDFPDCPEILTQRHAIQVTGESALEYETAVNQLLNSIGYATY